MKYNNTYLKHIKLFEAFDSIHISKTLKFINTESKEKFLNVLQIISDNINMPLSKYTDEYFKYMPFNKALQLNNNDLPEEKCTQTSSGAFPGYGVEGEVCDNGRIKRIWGSNYRIVTCPSCDGSGMKKITKGDLKYIKFWFNKDGKYINFTGSDGTNTNKITSSVDESLFNITKTIITMDDLLELKSGSIIKLRLRDESIYRISHLYTYRGIAYFIHNDPQRNGDRPEGPVEDWSIYGSKSWKLSRSEFSFPVYVLEPKEEGNNKITADPYSWNHLLSSNLSVNKNVYVKDYIKDADFAIVLNFKELKNSNFNKLTDIKTDRKKSKENALAFLEDEEINKINIKNYFDKMSSSFKISSEFKDFKSLIIRYLGGSKMGYNILLDHNVNDFMYLIGKIQNFIENNSENNYKYLKEDIKDTYLSNFNRNKLINLSLSKVKDDTLVKIIDEINNEIFNKIDSLEYDILEDIIALYYKIKTYRSIFQDKRTYCIRQTLEYIKSPEYITTYLNGISTSTRNETIEQLELIYKIIKRA